jgi:phosphatidylglycerol lysyltransferase
LINRPWLGYNIATMKRILHIFGRLLILLVFLGAAWLLYDRLKQYSLRQILDALANISAWHIAAAALLTLLNYAILVGYDWFAVRWVGEKDLPLRKIAMASFTGYAFSYNFGATLFGTSIRYRLYSAWGMSLGKILDLLVILGLTFWFGVFTLAGIVFMARPFRIPNGLKHELEHLKINIPFDHTFWLGALLLLLAVLYVAFAALRRKPLELFGWRIPLPPLKLTLYQIAIACGDLLVAALVLYTLLPPIAGGYLRILGVFMLAFVVAVLTHVPGGYGVFDALIIHFLPKDQGASVVAALLVFRVVYYWVPLLIAGVMLGYHEVTLSNSANDGPPGGSQEAMP